MLTLVSLFSGVGGFEEAFRRVGVKTVASVEIDKYCRQILSRHFPDTAIFEDVTKVGGDDLRAAGFIPERGIITAGFPCQDLSVAGKGRGLAGERSGLFWEIIRLLKELRPKWFVLENVPRLLTINEGRDMGAVTEALAECGYGFAWRVLSAEFFGVPQKRRRLFIVGRFGDECPAEVLFEPEGVPGDTAQSEESRQESPATPVGSARDGRAAVTHTHTHTHTSQLSKAAGRGVTGSTPKRQPVGT